MPLKLVKFFLIAIRAVFFVCALIFLGWLVFKDLVVGGKLTANFDFKKASPFISYLRPADRISVPMADKNDYYINIANQPVYFDVRLPRRFNVAKVKLKYQNLDQTIFEIGAMADKDRWQFDLKPIENQAINSLLNDKFHWSALTYGQTILFQKKIKYSSIAEFLDNLPPIDEIAVYNYELPYDYKIKNYFPADNEYAINKTLRGSHRFYTYIKKETLNFHFLIHDLNRHQGDDYLNLEVYRGKELIYSDFLGDDGNVSDNFKFSDPKEMAVFLPDLPEGVYRLELTTPSDDIVIRRIKTTQKLLTFINSIYLGDNVGYSDEFQAERTMPTNLYSNGHIFSAFTTHKEGLQVINFAGRGMLKVEATHQEFKQTLSYGFGQINIPKNDIRLSTKGLLAFSKESFFNPGLVTLADGEEFNQDQINYVITNYAMPAAEDNWKIVETDFNLANYYTLDNKLHFVLSLPNLEAGQQGINLSEIEVKLERAPLDWQTIVKYFKNIINLK